MPNRVLAKVQLTVEVDVGSWTMESTMSQIRDQGIKDAQGHVRRLLAEGDSRGIRLVGEPTVSQVYATE
jgi:hypothetical protein